KADVFQFLDEGEDVARLVAAEAIVVLMGGVDGKGAGLFLVKGAEASVVLRAGFAELEVVADDADDVSLLLDELSEVIRHGRRFEVLSPSQIYSLFCSRIGLSLNSIPRRVGNIASKHCNPSPRHEVLRNC